MKRKPRLGSIYLRGRTYWLKYYRKGRVFRESSGSNNYADAERLLKLRQGEIVRGKFSGLAVERITVGQLFIDVETDYVENGRKSLSQLQSRLRNHLMPAFEDVRAAEFGTDDLKRYRARRLRDGAALSTVNRELEIVKRAWTMALESDPPRVSRPLKIPMYVEANVRTGFLDDDGYAALLAALPDYLRPLLLLAYHVPSRRSELTGLKFNQLDFIHDEIVLNPGATKNGEGRRMPMFGPMKDCLEGQKAIRDARFPICENVFFGEKGGRIVDFRKAWQDACERVGMPGLLFHDLRRSAARNMRRAGISESVVMKIAGWKTTSMFRRYDIVDGRDLKEAGRRMEEYRNTALQKPATGTISGTLDTRVARRPTRTSERKV
jgi:integrase